MTVKLRLLSIVLVLVVAAIAGRSYPTLYGDSGLVQVPSAAVMPLTFVDVTINYANIRENGAKHIIYPLRLTYGASDNTELFVMLSESIGSDGFDAKGGGLKVRLFPEDLYAKTMGMAIGGRIYTVQGSRSRTVTDAYAVASKPLISYVDPIDDKSYNIRLHGAVNFTRYTGEVSDNFFGLMGGISYQHADGTMIVADFVPKQESHGVLVRKAALSMAFRRPISESFMAEIGTAQLFSIGDTGNLYVGINYRYGMRDIPRGKKPPISSY